MNSQLPATSNLQYTNQLFGCMAPMSRLETLCISSILCKSVNKLAIIHKLLPDSNRDKWILYKQLPQKLKTEFKKTSVQQKKKIPEKLISLASLKTLNSSLLKVLQETLTEVSNKGTTAHLEYMLHCEDLRITKEIKLEEENNKYNKAIKQLKEEIKRVEDDFNKTELFLNETKPCLEQAAINSWVQEHTMREYYMAMEKANMEQNRIQIRIQEMNTFISMSKTIGEITIEQKIHKELEEHLVYEVRELNKKLEYWIRKYNEEIEKLDIDILQQKSKQEELKKQVQSILEAIESTQEPLRTLREESDEREKCLKQELQERIAARKIQKWWKHILLKRRVKRGRRNKKSQKNSIRVSL